MTRSEPARLSGDAGQIGGIEVLPLGFLLFVSVTLLLVNVWGVVDAKFAVTAAAREASRAFVEADSEPEAMAAARQHATDTLAAFGRDGERASVGEPALAAAYGRCARVAITVSYRVPVIAVPFLGGFGSLAPVTSTHTEIVDPFRDGLDGPARC